jgi:hypothetical protein
MAGDVIDSMRAGNLLFPGALRLWAVPYSCTLWIFGRRTRNLDDDASSLRDHAMQKLEQHVIAIEIQLAPRVVMVRRACQNPAIQFIAGCDYITSHTTVLSFHLISRHVFITSSKC